ncbi:fasciclin domain-containing protein [Ekhidna sp.]|uniref:fasciclin domain-containing protein n=1 Tax=Ekhidna sp. TaxID=2608089 RepID=UPI003299E7D1
MKKSILKYFKAFTLIGVVASFIALSSCGSDDDAGPTLTVWGTLEADASLSLLKGEFEAFADIEATLSDEDATLTVFAPTNAALNTLLGTLGLEDFSSVNGDIARAVLEYHIVTSGQLASSALTDGSTTTTEQGEAITVTDGKLVTGATSDAEFVTTDIQTTNGVIHIVDVVLVPPTIGAQIVATLGTLAQPVALGADFTTLYSAILKADAAATDPTTTIMAALINADTTLTCFFPTNATFAGADPVITVDTYDAATWNAIIKNHIVSKQGGATDESVEEADMITGFTATSGIGVSLFFVNTGSATNVPGGPGIYIDSDGDFDAQTGAGLNGEVALIDAATAQNGRIHAIAGVLSPPQ